MNNPKPSFETSVDVQKCIDFLRDKNRISYAEVSHHLGRKVNGRDRYILQSARNQLEKQQDIVFVTERGVGLARATNGQCASLSTIHPIARIKRVTRKAERRQRLVNIQELSADDRLAFSIGRTVLAAVGKATLKSFRSQIQRELEKRDGEFVTPDHVLALPRHRKKKD